MTVEAGNGTAVGNVTAVQLSSPNVPYGARHYATIVNSGASTIYVAGDDTVDNTGFPLAADSVLTGELEPGEELWGICAAATSSTFSHLRTGV